MQVLSDTPDDIGAHRASIAAHVARIAKALCRLEVTNDAGVTSALLEIDKTVRQLSRALTHDSNRSMQPHERSALLDDLSKWSSVDRMVRTQVPSRPVPLFPPPNAVDPVGQAHAALTDWHLDDLHAAMTCVDQSADARARGCYSDITYPHTAFTRQIHAARRVRLALAPGSRTGFLDVGCGSGMKLLLAARVFESAQGIEFDTGFASLARGLLQAAPQGNCSVFEGDALEFADYGQYDVIYFFRPMRHTDQLARLEDCIVSSARNGAILIAPYPQFANRAASLGCAHIGEAVYLSGASQDEADELRAKAEFTGLATNIPRPEQGSLWQPILEGSA